MLLTSLRCQNWHHHLRVRQNEDPFRHSKIHSHPIQQLLQMFQDIESRFWLHASVFADRIATKPKWTETAFVLWDIYHLWTGRYTPFQWGLIVPHCRGRQNWCVLKDPLNNRAIGSYTYGIMVIRCGTGAKSSNLFHVQPRRWGRPDVRIKFSPQDLSKKVFAALSTFDFNQREMRTLMIFFL